MGRIHKSAWLLAVSSGALQVLIFPTPDLHYLCWIAFAPLLVAILHAREPQTVQLPESLGGGLVPATLRQGFLLAYVSGLIWSAGTCYWIYHVMHVYGGLASPVALGVLFLFCLALAVHHGVFGLLLALAAGHRQATRRALVLAPFLWVTVELLRTAITGFPWDLLGTVQVDNIPLSSIASVTGVYGVSFEIMLVNAAFAAAFLTRRGRRLVLAAAIIAAVVLQAGELVQPPRLAATETARLVQTNIPILNASWSAEYFDQNMRDLAAISVPQPGSETPAQPTPGLVVWPESPAPFFVSDPRFRAAVSQLASRAHAYFVVGSLGASGAFNPSREPDLYNSAALIAPDGRWLARYDKIHLVPFGEYVPFGRLLSFAQKLTREVGAFVPGAQRNVFVMDGYKLGVFICYESIFPGEIRQFAANGGQVFVNISNDGWFGNTAAPLQHLNQARMRAIENRRWLLRSTNTGITVSIDPYGRVVARAPRNVRTVLDAPFSIVSASTFYTRHGDWFTWACAIISVVALIIFRIRSRARVP